MLGKPVKLALDNNIVQNACLSLLSEEHGSSDQSARKGYIL
jgi:hypothetical protein